MEETILGGRGKEEERRRRRKRTRRRKQRRKRRGEEEEEEGGGEGETKRKEEEEEEKGNRRGDTGEEGGRGGVRKETESLGNRTKGRENLKGVTVTLLVALGCNQDKTLVMWVGSPGSLRPHLEAYKALGRGRMRKKNRANGRSGVILLVASMKRPSRLQEGSCYREEQ
jgi:hypothetical protein